MYFFFNLCFAGEGARRKHCNCLSQFTSANYEWGLHTAPKMIVYMIQAWEGRRGYRPWSGFNRGAMVMWQDVFSGKILTLKRGTPIVNKFWIFYMKLMHRGHVIWGHKVLFSPLSFVLYLISTFPVSDKHTLYEATKKRLNIFSFYSSTKVLMLIIA